MFDETFIFYLEWAIFVLNIFSILILIVGIFLVLKTLFQFQSIKKSYVQRNQRNAEVRKLLASYILLSLEVLVVADIVESIIRPTWSDILKLAVMVIIRTVISYFLNREISDKQKRVRGSEG
ncbi:DUF1622 domain-containing protein [Enterococcus sp. DIV0660C]|uniref:DUF1622 domain-containing protein n=1 Tax=Enterococcus sp. DIV0660C TaxID=2230880 RepID=UPI001A8F377E|nr:DUF1622 domain-containing protein [Enterococcus sp. DIV0660C]MBO0431753.1 DUF1622 domain-containing protein [Enterococcus sp. DIV0660C]